VAWQDSIARYQTGGLFHLPRLVAVRHEPLARGAHGHCRQRGVAGALLRELLVQPPRDVAPHGVARVEQNQPRVTRAERDLADAARALLHGLRGRRCCIEFNSLFKCCNS
jgi:hypothetical protein